MIIWTSPDDTSRQSKPTAMQLFQAEKERKEKKEKRHKRSGESAAASAGPGFLPPSSAHAHALRRKA